MELPDRVDAKRWEGLEVVDRDDQPLGSCVGVFADADTDVLSDLDLEIAPGETVALVGATGSGKSVLTMLVPRLYDVTAGRITIDGVNVADVPRLELRQHIRDEFRQRFLLRRQFNRSRGFGDPLWRGRRQILV